MAKRKRREFTDEFKNQIVQLYLNGKSKSELAKEYDLPLSSLGRWINSIRKQAHSKRKITAVKKKMSS